MTAFLFVLIYAALLVSLAGIVARAVHFARMPLHLRWELYPVPHEEPERAAHGGSYFEEVDWWTRPAEYSLWGELKVMVPEMVFMQALWEHNRKLWFRSFPFHFGLYLTLASAALAALSLPAAPTGIAGAVLVILGAAALLHRRLTDPDLKPFTVPADIVNLLLFILTFAALLAAQAAGGLTAVTRAVLTFNTAADVPALPLAAVTLAALLAAYVPLTHMAHFVAKYFTYHSVRWDDVPLARRREMERRIAAQLALRPSWSAPHVGRGTWAEIATRNPFEVKK